MKVYEYIALAIEARANCRNAAMYDTARIWDEVLASIARECLPRGSGFDAGTAIELDEDTPRTRVRLYAAYHHMNEAGMYDGWTEHTVTVRASFLGGFELSVSGTNRNQIKDYIFDVFHAALNLPVPASCEFQAHMKEAA